MTENRESLDQYILSRALRLNATVSGIVVGLVAGIGLFIATNWLVIKGGAVVGPHLTLLGQYFIGYRVSFVGSLIGFGYAFVVGFILGYFVARVYNLVLDIRERDPKINRRGSNR